MEPVKGGSLANLPPKAKAILDSLGNNSPASYAIRFAAGFDGVMTVLSGMGNLDMVADNISYMSDFSPLDDVELSAIKKVCDVLRAENLVQCTACRYCIADCPRSISIPDLFACMNAKLAFNNWNSDFYYNDVHTKGKGRASDCIGCGKCEEVCPQKLEIRRLLKEVADAFDKKQKI